MPIIDKFKDLGTVVMGKIEWGSVREGDSLVVMPNKVCAKKIFHELDMLFLQLYFSFLL